MKRQRSKQSELAAFRASTVLVNLLQNFQSWFHPPSTTKCSFSFSSQYVITLQPSPSSTASPITILPPPLSSPCVFLSVYLSTFTVTALESQESETAPPAPRSRSTLLSGSPSFSVTSVKIYIASVEKVHFSPPRGVRLSSVLVTQSHPVRSTTPHPRTWRAIRDVKKSFLNNRSLQWFCLTKIYGFKKD